ncbi:MAG TPA: hypothetical protein VIX38_02260, partial [Nitrososphaeraceae archaeon]
NVFSENVLAEISKGRNPLADLWLESSYTWKSFFIALKISLFRISLISNAMLVMYFTTEK